MIAVVAVQPGVVRPGVQAEPGLALLSGALGSVAGGLVLKNLKAESSQAVLPLPKFCAAALAEGRHLQELERQIARADRTPGAG